MTWTNAFDVGACTVKVMDGTTELFSQVMAKGASATYTDADLGSATVDVSSAGVVSITGTATFDVNKARALRVVPVLAPSDPCRISAVTAYIGPYDATATASGSYADASKDVALSGPPSLAWGPDPCALPSGSVEMSLAAAWALV